MSHKPLPSIFPILDHLQQQQENFRLENRHDITTQVIPTSPLLKKPPFLSNSCSPRLHSASPPSSCHKSVKILGYTSRRCSPSSSRQSQVQPSLWSKISRSNPTIILRPWLINHTKQTSLGLETLSTEIPAYHRATSILRPRCCRVWPRPKARRRYAQEVFGHHEILEAFLHSGLERSFRRKSFCDVRVFRTLAPL